MYQGLQVAWLNTNWPNFVFESFGLIFLGQKTSSIALYSVVVTIHTAKITK